MQKILIFFILIFLTIFSNNSYGIECSLMMCKEMNIKFKKYEDDWKQYEEQKKLITNDILYFKPLSKLKNKNYNYQKPSLRNNNIKKMIWPVKGKISSYYGLRRSPFSGRFKYHKGLDIAAPIGKPIRAVADGVVIYSGWKSGYGKMIIIKHKNNLETIYGHSKINHVKKGDFVKKGQIISRVGNTGKSTGPHLHFEIRNKMGPQNPLSYLG
jgi:murein DD-endopeptidase MepM/ murein hydrolase activator NlpD